jgi:hypothetical protein
LFMNRSRSLLCLSPSTTRVIARAMRMYHIGFDFGDLEEGPRKVTRRGPSGPFRGKVTIEGTFPPYTSMTAKQASGLLRK